MAEPPQVPSETFERLGRLRVDVSTGDPAPHKPLLLLVVLELAELGKLDQVLALTPQLAFRFCTYFSITAHRRGTRPDIRLPFHHLGGDELWTPQQDDGSPSDHRKATVKAQLSPGLLALATDTDARDAAKRLLIARYFRPEERPALYSLVGLAVPREDQIQRDAQLGEVDRSEEAGRSARFRIEVVAAYDYTCALTGHRLLTIDAGSIVDAAHIRAFSDSRNNDPRNGVALTKNMHWAFDEGLWTVDKEYRILVATSQFAESCPDGRLLSEYDGTTLRLPTDQARWPDPEYFAWHRRRRYVG